MEEKDYIPANENLQKTEHFSIQKQGTALFGWWVDHSSSKWIRYGIAVLSVSLALLIDEVDFLTGGFRIYLVFYPFIVIATLFGGAGPGLLATVLSCLSAAFYWMEPVGQFAIASRADMISMAMFIAGNLFFIWICTRLRRALRQAAEAEAHRAHALKMTRQTEVLKQNERELMRREQVLKDAQRMTHVGCWQRDPQTNEIHWSDELYRIFGRDPRLPPPSYREFAGIFTIESAARLDEAVKKISETGESYRLTLEFTHPDGSHRWVTVGGEALRDTQGKVIRILGTAQDITERIRAEEALRESESFAASVRDSLLDHLAVVDAEGTIIAVNRAWTRFAEENDAPELARKSVGMNYLEVCDRAVNYPDGEEAAAAKAGILAVINGEQSEFSLEYPCHAPHFQRWFQMHVSPLNGSRKGAVIAHRDTTQHKLAEIGLAKSKETAETANRAKARFIAVLSHELRTPLTPVLATVSAMKDRADLSAMMRGVMTLIYRNVEMEAVLIDDLLDVTRINSGKISMHSGPVNAHACLKAALDTARKEISAKNLKLSVDANAARHHVWADSTRLQQVFWNLLRNAVKFTPDKGKISIRSYSVDNRLKIEIADNGIGIPPEVLPRIFDPFEQGEQATTRFFGGLGLGLSIAKAVVELHQGKLYAFSDGKDKGATFTVELPTIPAVPEPQAAPSTPPLRTNRMPLKILLVEDHADTLDVMAKLLLRSGYDVKTASTLRSALDLAEHETFDLLISDLGLPDGSGLDLLQAAKKFPHLQDLHGIALSGYGTEEDLTQSRNAGYERHLTKPVSFEALRQAIEQVTSLSAR